jgi:purine nucleoside phosphorylase
MLVFSGRKKEKLKSSRKIDVAIIGGTGLESLLKDAEQTHIGTFYGLPSPIAVGELMEFMCLFCYDTAQQSIS